VTSGSLIRGQQLVQMICRQ